jgi:hypothetical protein
VLTLPRYDLKPSSARGWRAVLACVVKPQRYDLGPALTECSRCCRIPISIAWCGRHVERPHDDPIPTERQRYRQSKFKNHPQHHLRRGELALAQAVASFGTKMQPALITRRRVTNRRTTVDYEEGSMGPQWDKTLASRGDSITAPRRAELGCARSDRSARSAYLMAMFCSRLGAQISETTRPRRWRREGTVSRLPGGRNWAVRGVIDPRDRHTSRQCSAVG